MHICGRLDSSRTAAQPRGMSGWGPRSVGGFLRANLLCAYSLCRSFSLVTLFLFYWFSFPDQIDFHTPLSTLHYAAVEKSLTLKECSFIFFSDISISLVIPHQVPMSSPPYYVDLSHTNSPLSPEEAKIFGILRQNWWTKKIFHSAFVVSKLKISSEVEVEPSLLHCLHCLLCLILLTLLSMLSLITLLTLLLNSAMKAYIYCSMVWALYEYG